MGYDKLILVHAVHPPGISTALGFAFSAREEHAAQVFLLALLVVALLIVIERLVLRALHDSAEL